MCYQCMYGRSYGRGYSYQGYQAPLYFIYNPKTGTMSPAASSLATTALSDPWKDISMKEDKKRMEDGWKNLSKDTDSQHHGWKGLSKCNEVCCSTIPATAHNSSQFESAMSAPATGNSNVSPTPSGSGWGALSKD